ncbi:MAG: DHH family phosphoesterase [Lachnospiraceae bacterium]|nr:DHH family phosphoesterase [Lachnospiraceae bacterium]
MRLKELLNYSNVVIQTHDNPDADALASGYAVYLYLKENNVPARFIYGGKFPLQKANLVLMKETYDIPIEYVKEIEEPELLITVDCQYGEGNVFPFPAKNVAVIDHHRVSRVLPEMNEVRSNLGSCSTLVWDLLRRENIDVNDNPTLATALYYGLLTDTNNFAELSHPLDRDIRDYLRIRRSDIALFRNSNLSLNELKIAGDALGNASYSEVYRYGLVEAQPCDPNILGVISDMFLEVEGVDGCLVYSILNFGVKISVRSCVKEIKGNELADYLATDIGSGGGHIDKAGGFLERDLIEKQGVVYNSDSIRGFLAARMDSYFRDSKIIYAKEGIVDLSGYPKYAKKALHLGYVDPAELGLVGKTVSIRTLEGDVDVLMNDNIYIMIGFDGEVYPQKKEFFLKNNVVSDEPYVFPGEYEPTVKDAKTGIGISVIPYARSCISTGKGTIYAKKLDNRVKVFTSWDEEKYYLGKPGDYLAARTDDPLDVYVIADYVFQATYESVE